MEHLFKRDRDLYWSNRSHQIDNLDSSIRGIGWYIDPKYQQKGYATEAAEAMIKYLFEEVKINSIQTKAAVNNIASWKIMEHLGFKRLPEKLYFSG